MSETPIGLQSRPPLLIAIGGLEAMVQSQLQIALRVVTTKMAVPCTTVLERSGDIVLAESPVANHIRVSCAQGHRDLERPVRMVPLADALGELIDAIVAADHPATQSPAPASAKMPAPATLGASHPAAPAVAAPTPLGAPTLETLINRSDAGPLRITLADGTQVFVDAAYHSAWLSAAPGPGLAAALMAPARETLRATTEEMQQVQGPQATHHRVAVEQLCWMGSQTPGLAPTLERWVADRNAFVRLETWPNLSLQSDFLPWLNVLGALRARPRSLAETQALGAREGIDASRLAFGLAMLFTFGHATLERSAPAAPAAPPPTVAPAPAVAEAISTGVMSRLRSRLRSLLG